MEMSEVPHVLPSGSEHSSTRDDDLAMQSAALSRVLVVYPAKLTVAELTRELVGEEPDFGAKDAVERAARDLSGVGLLHLHGEFVSPTRAALRDHELLDL